MIVIDERVSSGTWDQRAISDPRVMSRRDAITYPCQHGVANEVAEASKAAHTVPPHRVPTLKTLDSE